MKFSRSKNRSEPIARPAISMFGDCSSRRCQRGLTLIEILMTIFVLAVGLLGVAALMPVGSYQMQRGQIAQRVSEIGPSALDEIEAREFNNPGKWLKANGAHFDAVSDRSYNYNDPNPITAKYTHPVSNEPLDAVYNRTAFPVASSGSFGSTTGLPSDVESGGAFLLEFARCGNARLFGGQWQAPSTPLGSTDSALMPSAGDVYTLRRCEPFAIDPLYVAQHSTGNNIGDDFVPSAWSSGGTAIGMPRITLHNGLNNPQSTLTKTAAEAIFVADTDHQYVLDDTGWPTGREAHGPVGSPTKTKSLGDYSWLATFSPSESTSGNDPRSWTVSVAVFYKRPLLVRSTANNPDSDPQRTLTLEVDANGNKFLKTAGIAELLFEDANDDGVLDKEAGEQMRVKRGMWGLVTFEHSDAGGQLHRKARWYRMGVVGSPLDAANHTTQVRLIGPELPQGTAKITFFDNLEGVFSRTIAAEELPLGPT